MSDLFDCPAPAPRSSGRGDETAPSSVGAVGTVAPATAGQAGPSTSGSRLVDHHVAASRKVENLAPIVGRTVVVVPHPDDEALATGGLIAHQRSRGHDVIIVAATDGDAAYPDWIGVDLARVRRREQLDSLEHLGVGRGRVHRLEMPDGRVAEHVDEVAALVADVVEQHDVLIAPAVFDWHPDHEACGRAAITVATQVGCRLLGSLFWAHHHPDHAPSDLQLAVLALTNHEVARRRAALECHHSQLRPSARTTAAPILPQHVLGLLDRPFEYYVVGAHAVDEPLRDPGGAAT